MVGDQVFDELYNIVIGITYSINDIVASKEVFRLSPERRKCLFQSESRSKYFSVRKISGLSHRSRSIYALIYLTPTKTLKIAGLLKKIM